MIHFREPLSRIAILGWFLLGLTSQAAGQASSVGLQGQLDSDVWKLRVNLSDDEYEALEPAAPQMGFSAPTAPPSGQNWGDSRREKVGNLFGVQFPWVRGSVDFTSGDDEPKTIPCRIRYDGDFTYTMAAQSPKRPMFIQLLDGHDIQGVSSFRLHTMQFDQTMLRERITSHVFASLDATVTRTAHAELSLKVGNKKPEFIGLYTILEAVDATFLSKNGIPETWLVSQTNGLNTIRYAGENWNAYARTFRSSQRPSDKQQTRIIEFAKLIDEATDEEFDARISDFINTDELLRYLAANSLTSNVTGMSTIGTNDFLCLDAEGRFHIIANQMETALGGSVLSGSPDELTNMHVVRPYAGECKLFDRLLANEELRDRYLNIVRESVDGFFTPEKMNPLMAGLTDATANSRERETQAAAERLRTMMQSIGGGISPPRGTGGFGPPPMAPSTFVEKRNGSIRKQLEGSEPGFTPRIPNLGGIGGGGSSGGRQGATAAITDAQFRESVQVSGDFNATLFARSPEVNYPVAIAAEPTGAIYVASDEQGSLGADKDGGKVLRCVDHDGDGVMDSVTTFCRVDHVRGVVYRAGAVWVSHPPYLSVFHDDDGDGVADRNQRLVSGLTTDMVNTRGGDHTTNGVRMGIDGWLYIGNGDYGTPKGEGVDGSTVVLRGGGILRVRPDGTELELFASGLRNPFDIAIDPQLNLFTRDNTNDGGGWDTRVSQLFQTAEYGYPRLFANFSDEIMPTLGVFGNGGGTGSLYIEDESWPERWNRSLLTGDWGRSGVFHHPLTPDGATFQLTQQTFATISRATGMDLDASGNLYVASWWGGEASVHVGPHVGFVTRLTPKGSTPREFPNLSDASAPELVERLRSSSAVVRFHIQGELLKRGNVVVGALSDACRNGDFPLEGRIAALFAVKQIQGIRSHELLKSLTADCTIREFAIRALTDRKTQLDGLDADFFVPFLSDESPRVRAQAVIALGRLGDVSAARKIIPLARQANEKRPDPAEPNAGQVIPHLALRALVELNAVDACLAELDGPNRTAALRALRSMHSPATVDGLIERLGAQRDLNKRNELLVTLIRLYQRETPYDGSWWGIRPDTTGPFYDPTTWEQSERIAAVLTSAIKAAEPESAKRLNAELVRHQVTLAGLGSMTESLVVEEKSIVIIPVDPSNPSQLGNIPYADVLTRTQAIKGDPKAGAAVFKSRSCSACHTSAAGQKPVGPHLADIGKRYKPAELIESILKPSEKIAQGYETQAFLTDSGNVITGFVTSEKGKEITVRNSQGVTHRILRDQIEERIRKKTSAMPSGLVGSLTINELADLIAYLRSL
ncbi:DUF7133 domain-containing protein [Rhodopirellula bahusiensis]|uniref:DUF7133 domain-containing protein n=4 Tax=Rhodopirellula bahusiensis TaxID=2014065 RepID=UPI0032673891